MEKTSVGEKRMSEGLYYYLIFIHCFLIGIVLSMIRWKSPYEKLMGGYIMPSIKTNSEDNKK